MQQQVSVVTLGIASSVRSRSFYVNGFGWTPVFENAEVAFYQMNGLILGTWVNPGLDNDMQRPSEPVPSAFALGHNVADQADVERVIQRLVEAGGTPFIRPTHLHMAVSAAMLRTLTGKRGRSP